MSCRYHARRSCTPRAGTADQELPAVSRLLSRACLLPSTGPVISPPLREIPCAGLRYASLLPGVSLFGFIRIATNPRVFEQPLHLASTLERVEAWLSQPHVHFLVPGPRHLEIAFGLLRELGAAKNLTTDVQLAAHAIENQATLCSNDSDFARFPGLRWQNPLEPSARRRR